MILRFYSIFFVFFVVVSLFVNQSFAADGRSAIGLPTADLTIFRTVWNLSCHPQNPLLHEVPHYVMYAPDWTPATGVVSKDGYPYKSKGACWAYHNEGNTNFVPFNVGDKGNPGSEDENTIRPNTPIHHYMVIEFPNPVYDPANDAACKNGTIQQKLGAAYKPKHEFCAPYLHWEGYARLKQLSISEQEKEVWYVENFLGGWTLDGKNVIDGYPSHAKLFNTPVGTVNGKNVYSAVLVIDPKNSIVLKICGGFNHAAWPRPGDGEKNDFHNTRPCWEGSGGDGRVFDSRDVPNPAGVSTPTEIHPNPLLFSDIPHGRFMRNPRNDSRIGDGGDDVGNVKHVREWFDDDTESRLLHIPDPRYPNEDDKGDYLMDDHDDDWVKCSGQAGQQDIYSSIFDGQYSGRISGGIYNSATNKTTLDYTSYRDYIKEFKKVLKARSDPTDPEGATISDPKDSTGARIDIPLAPVIPFACDYRPLLTDPGVEINPTTGKPDMGPNPIGKIQRLAALINSWTTAQLNLPSGAPTPIATPRSTATSTTRKQADILNPVGVDIFDLNQVIEDYDRTGPNGWIPSDIVISGKIDLFDYNLVIEQFDQ